MKKATLYPLIWELFSHAAAGKPLRPNPSLSLLPLIRGFLWFPPTIKLKGDPLVLCPSLPLAPGLPPPEEVGRVYYRLHNLMPGYLSAC